MRRVLIVLAILAIVVLVYVARSCEGARRSAAISAWLLCGECRDGELPALLGYRRAVVRPLSAALLDGPPTDRRVAMAAQFRATFSGASGLPESTYVRQMVENYVALYQRRAVAALRHLADSGVAGARGGLGAALDSVRNGSRVFRLDVVRDLIGAVAAAGVDRYPGDPGPPTVAFLDTVTLRRHRDPVPWDSSARVTLTDNVFGNLAVERSPDSIRFVAVGLVGSHPFLLQDSARRQTGSIFISRLSYRPHSPAAAESLLADRPHTRYVALRAGSEYFRVLRVGSDTLVEAEVTWADPADVLVTWRRCTPPYAPVMFVNRVSPTTGAAIPVAIDGVVRSDTGPVAGARVLLPRTGLAALTDTAGRFRLDGILGTDPTEDLTVSALGHVPMSVRAHPGIGDYVIVVARAPGTLQRRAVSLPGNVARTCLLAVELRPPPGLRDPVVLRVDVRPR